MTDLDADEISSIFVANKDLLQSLKGGDIEAKRLIYNRLNEKRVPVPKGALLNNETVIEDAFDDFHL